MHVSCAELLHIAGITTLQTPGAGSSPLGPSNVLEQRTLSGGEEPTSHASDILDSTSFELKLDKSNILMLGPTGTGCPGIFFVYGSNRNSDICSSVKVGL